MRLVFALLVVASFAVTGQSAPLTPDRVAALPESARAAWTEYLLKSEQRAREDQDALQAELNRVGLPAALKAPNGGDFKLPAERNDPYYQTEEAHQLAAVILSYQTPAGGWSKHTGYSAGARQPGMLFSSQYQPGNRPHYLGTFDNRSTTEQLHFLANLNEVSPRDEYRVAIMRGINYILEAQYPNGGWPQVYPLQGGYHDNITFNDDAMTHVLGLLQTIDSGHPGFAVVDEPTRQRIRAAFTRGIECVIALQVEIDGKPTIWCAQFDPLTGQPAAARAMEPATLAGVESARILRMLMSVEKPNEAVINAIESGLAWLDQARITGLRRVNRDGKTAFDEDPASSEVYWARFYRIETGKPVFPGRDGILYDTFAEMAARNELGYDYYSTIPGSVLNSGQRKWRKTHGR